MKTQQPDPSSLWPDGGHVPAAEIPRRGDWCQTYTGRVVYPLDLRPEEIDIEDVAHALALQCRFNGHTRVFYSVAEHAVRVSHVCDPADALWGLLHDAAEAYVGDCVRPLKIQPELEFFRQSEDLILYAVCARFGLSFVMPESVKRADIILVLTEGRDLMGHGAPETWGLAQGRANGLQPLPETIIPWSPTEAEARFRGRFTELTR